MTAAPPEREGVAVLHRDAHLLVLTKPPGLPTTAPRGGGRALVDVARALDPGAERLHPTSRLDAGVSGLVTFARTAHATRALLDARRRGRYRRAYAAIALAAPPDPPADGALGLFDWRIDLDPADPRRRRALEPGEPGRAPREARTRWRVAERGPTGAVLLALYPHTGRTHQLRVHAARAGAPLFGDTLYGGLARATLSDGRVVAARRPMLHCAAVALPDVVHPGRSLELAAPWPDDLTRAWTALGGAALPPPGALALPAPRR